MYPQRRELLNKYKITDFPEQFRHKIPHLLFLSVMKAEFIHINHFMSQNYDTHAGYCNTILAKINISPPIRRPKPKMMSICTKLFGKKFTPTLDDDEIMTLVHELPVVDEHFLTKYDELIDSAVLSQNQVFFLDLACNGHWNRFIQLIQLYNKQINKKEFVKVMQIIYHASDGMKRLLQAYLHECIKMKFKIKLNEKTPAATREDLQLPLTREKLDEMIELLTAGGDGATSVQSTILRSVKIKREWRAIQEARKQEWEQHAKVQQAARAKRDKKRKKKGKTGKVEIDEESSDDTAEEDNNMNDNNNNNSNEQQHDEKKDEPMEPKITAVTFLSKTITNQFLSTLVCLQQNIRELQTHQKLLNQIQSWNEGHSFLGME